MQFWWENILEKILQEILQDRWRTAIFRGLIVGLKSEIYKIFKYPY